MKRIFITAILGVLAIVGPATRGHAERYSIFDVAHRTTLTASAGYLYNSPEGGASEWRGVDAGPALTYSLAAPQPDATWYPPLSLFVQYVHGFPFDAADWHQNRLRAAFNLKVSPQPNLPSINRKFGTTLAHNGLMPLTTGGAVQRLVAVRVRTGGLPMPLDANLASLDLSPEETSRFIDVVKAHLGQQAR